jgi:hypothetical protein
MELRYSKSWKEYTFPSVVASSSLGRATQLRMREFSDMQGAKGMFRTET